MTREVEIRDKKTGQVLREAYVSEDKKYFGMFSLPDVIKLGSIWITIITLILGFDFRIKSLENDRPIVNASISKMIDFIKSSDNFNSTFFGTQFDNGKPIDPSWRSRNEGSLNQK